MEKIEEFSLERDKGEFHKNGWAIGLIFGLAAIYEFVAKDKLPKLNQRTIFFRRPHGL